MEELDLKKFFLAVLLACKILVPACKILVPGPRIEPMPPAAEVWSPNHWTPGISLDF